MPIQTPDQTIDLDALRAAPVTREPFPYMIVPHFVRADAIDAIEADYPDVGVPGSVPLPSLTYGPRFAQFMNDIRGPEMTALIAEKFNIDLSHRPTTVTVRGQCRATDGQIHTDSKTKLITVLIYMNGQWEQPGGRLRLLRTPDNLNDAFAEVPPVQGTLLAFRNQPNAWHGHESFAGPRRAIQLNWVRDSGVVWREQMRHRFSAFLKKVF
ncbi:MAG: 2OG-Fe(II) oxygenase [Alphaproteobacteria bacterium]|nr:2OG-Fe(II) oxygenase [Alphaproteobacteria bacterium]